jgi:hypothetical protein
VNAKVVREIVRHILNLTNGISAATP